MDDKEMLIQCYHTMYQGMIKKDMQLSMKAGKRNGKWYIGEAEASTY